MPHRSTRLVETSALLALFAFALTGCGGKSAAPTPTGVLPQTTARHAVAAIATVAKTRTLLKNTLVASDKNHLRAQAEVGSSNPATADMPVPRPNESPCVVQLFSGFTFTDFSQHLFNYTPPATCPGPWAKVVFDGDFSVSAGRQFDRTASIWVGGTNVYFGTTAEPSHTVSPTWHVERDVTDLSPIFTSTSTGQVVLGNVVNSTYTGVISASAKLEFYPANPAHPAANAPDMVYALSSGPLGDNVNLYTPSDQLHGTFTLPQNVERAYLDVYLQSQIGDEFWYTCFPNDLAQQLNNCGNTAFREGEVSIDGQSAGVAPVYPWIYTGGIDPYLWRPIPGVETLEFVPYRVNLTPFAGLLSNGQPHTVAVSVFNDGNYFATNGALLLYLDHGATHVTGGLISDSTSATPNVNVSEGVTIDAQGNAQGPISVTATHPVAVDGYVDTSHGRIETQVQQSISFVNAQNVVSTATQFQQNIQQATSIVSDTTIISGPGKRQWIHEQKAWPLTLDYLFAVNPDGSQTQKVSVLQGKNEQSASHTTAGGAPYRTTLANVVTSTDTLTFFATGGYAPSNGKSSQSYTYSTNTGICYSGLLTSANYAVTSSSITHC